MCWMKYHNHTHIKGIQGWIKQSACPKHEIVNMWIQKYSYYFQGPMYYVRKDMQSRIVLLCFFTSK